AWLENDSGGCAAPALAAVAVPDRVAGAGSAKRSDDPVPASGPQTVQYRAVCRWIRKNLKRGPCGGLGDRADAERETDGDHDDAAATGRCCSSRGQGAGCTGCSV